MVTMIQRHSPPPPVFTAVQEGHNLAVERVIAAMRDDVAYPYTLDTFAEIANYSPYHFARMFRGVVGVPPGEFLAALRFERAKELILQAEAKITEICMEVGFASLGTFSARFKQLVGRSPAELRDLPHAMVDRLPNLAACQGRNQFLSTGATLTGSVVSTTPRKGHLFIGLFPTAIPQASPVAGTLVSGPGPFRIVNVKPGTYHVLAAQFPFGDDPLVHLLPSTSLLVGSAGRPISIAPGVAPRPARVQLRPRVPTDPPILSTLAPSLLGL